MRARYIKAHTHQHNIQYKYNEREPHQTGSWHCLGGQSKCVCVLYFIIVTFCCHCFIRPISIDGKYNLNNTFGVMVDLVFVSLLSARGSLASPKPAHTRRLLDGVFRARSPPRPIQVLRRRRRHRRSDK